MDKPILLGRHLISERDIFLLDGALSPELRITLPSTFACFCALDASELSVDQIGDFCEALLRLGCVYFCVWGPNCERVHDIMDEILVGGNPPESSVDDIMTTWHADDTLIEALHFFLFDTTPYEDARAGCRSGLITAANPAWVTEIKQYISTHVAQRG